MLLDRARRAEASRRVSAPLWLTTLERGSVREREREAANARGWMRLVVATNTRARAAVRKWRGKLATAALPIAVLQ